MNSTSATIPAGDGANERHPIEPAQRSAARLAGLLYLLTNATAIVGYALRGPLLVRGNAAETANRIAASERVYRVSVVVDLVTVMGVIVLVWSLHVVLKPVNARLSLLATFFRLAENFILGAITLCAFAALAFVGTPEYLKPFAPAELQALIYALAVRIHGAGFNVGFVFLGVGSAIFSCIWYESRYVPRFLAVLGVVSSALMALVTLAIMIFPALSALGLTYMMPMGLFELGIGGWLLFVGIRLPPTARKLADAEAKP